MVGEALLDVGLIAGEDSEYGLYVKTVNGVTADYDTDQTYWAFYVNGEYAQSGTDSADITVGNAYSFKVKNNRGYRTLNSIPRKIKPVNHADCKNSDIS